MHTWYICFSSILSLTICLYIVNTLYKVFYAYRYNNGVLPQFKFIKRCQKCWKEIKVSAYIQGNMVCLLVRAFI